jgi:phosphoglucosamine mutase
MSIERKYFGTDGVRGRVGQYPVNAEFVLEIGLGCGESVICGR